MQTQRAIEQPSPQPGTPGQVAQASESQQLFSDSEIAPSGRHILLHETNPEEGTLLRLMHLQAWSGTRPRTDDWAEFTWLPREPAAIGTTGIVGSSEQASRLLVLATDQNSPLHARYLDPAGIAGQGQFRYRRPTVSPNGVYTTFFVQDRAAGTVSLWLGRWGAEARIVGTWDFPHNARIDARLLARWVRYDTLLFSTVTRWDGRYPQEITLKRLEITADDGFEVTNLRTFHAGGRDRAVDLIEFAVSPDREHLAFRVRRFSGNDPDEDGIDVIEVSPAANLGDRVEIVRADHGEGMIWTHNSTWLVAGVDGRIALLDRTGRGLRFLTDELSAYPVRVGRNEVWYQEMAPPWRIMRFSLYDTTGN